MLEYGALVQNRTQIGSSPLGSCAPMNGRLRATPSTCRWSRLPWRDRARRA